MFSLLRKINSNPLSNSICITKTSFAFSDNEFSSSNSTRKECWFKLNHFKGFRKLSTITRPLTLKERQNELRGYISGFPVDDIMDGSDTRWDQTCWHTLNDVGMRAINDDLATENGVYHISEKHFGREDYYVKLIECFHKSIFIGLLV